MCAGREGVLCPWRMSGVDWAGCMSRAPFSQRSRRGTSAVICALKNHEIFAEIRVARKSRVVAHRLRAVPIACASHSIGRASRVTRRSQSQVPENGPVAQGCASRENIVCWPRRWVIA